MLDSPAPFQALTIDSAPLQFTAIECGAGPLALFYHGITANAHVFEPLMHALADKFRCVAIDQRGHGGSSKPATGYDADNFADDIGAAIIALHAGPALLVGHSLGARNALAAAVKFPERVAAVVAIDFTSFIELEVFDARDARVAGGDQRFPSFDSLCDYLQSRYVKLPWDAVTRRALHGFVGEGMTMRPLADPAAMLATSRGLRDDLSAIVQQVSVPLMFIRGAQSKLVSPRAWAKTKALRPDCLAVELADADHYVPEEVPAAVAAEILQFWVAIESPESKRRT